MPIAQLPILLSTFRDGKDIVLRIDEGGWSEQKTSKLPVVSVRLYGVTSDSTDFSELEKTRGLECEIHDSSVEKNLVEVLIYCDFQVDPLTFMCERVSRERGLFEVSDFTAKIEWLAQRYGDAYDKSELNLAAFERYRSELDAGIRNLLARAKAKVEHFSPKGKGQSFLGEVKAYERVLQLMERQK